ncbi:ergothioneine biosynthesis protein EgtC [Catenulispora sp. NL8]|uniref:Gamma-glutamyl-hercynylcysteine sulfoxide hydrolase n=1 Tax=Catenulispora pinistramenti TaxID=2705254 RepID=A0ABS5KLY4_9ACTN|nr:ergothioneine biosynthesis protein EgtC [Catenulispora pinistramenti]MBS2547031.1 ergothioneine biosynthesis protein EgtC [Catenulispora pinistramenti]
MCRHLAYLGPRKSLRELLIDPPHSLYRQSWEPRRQRHGVVNADGFGVGWFAEPDPVPARYRQAGPIWADPSFPDIARVTRSGAVLAAVRDATTGSATGAEAAAPYSGSGWLFSHNGSIGGYPGSVAKLAESVPAADLLALESRTDSAFLWALIQARVREGAVMAEAVASVIADVAAVADARLNLLLMNDTTIVASVFGDTLSALIGDGFVAVGSEPYDDAPGWADVAEGVHTWRTEGRPEPVEGR